MTGALVQALRALIRAYQLVLSPLIGPACRFAPSCSEFAREALERHGPWRGSLLALRRLGRCHPFHPGGYDPVPGALPPASDAAGARWLFTRRGA